MTTALACRSFGYRGRAHRHIGRVSHPAWAVDFDVPAGQVTMLLGRQWARGKTTTFANDHGTVAGRRAARSRSTAQAIGGDSDGKSGGQRSTPENSRAPRHRLCARETWGIFGDLTVREKRACSQRAARALGSTTSTRIASSGCSGLFSGA